MSVRKLSENSGSVTVTLPKDDLREHDLLTEDGELDGERFVKIEEREDATGWEVKPLDL